MPVLSTLGAAIANVYGFTSGLIKDQYFNLVSLLLPGNGTNGAQNNTFLDGSSNTFTITRNGNTTQGTFSPFSQTGWGASFSGSNQLTIPSALALAPEAGQFCIEFWIYPTAAWSSVDRPIFVAASSGGLWVGWQSTAFVLRAYGVTNHLSYATAPTLNTWTHVAICRNSGNTTSMYFNGSRVATGTVTQNFAQAIAYIGSDSAYGAGGAALLMASNLSNLRLVKGSSVYDPTQTSITVPTSPLTAVTNTTLLICQSNRFVDNASTPNTITSNGNVSITPFSPFAPTQSYSASAVGGSGYFDGTGDFLEAGTTSSFNFMHNTTATFTIQGWIYPLALPGSGSLSTLFATATGSTDIGMGFYVNYSSSSVASLQLFIARGVGGSTVIDSGSSALIRANTWQHVAVTYDQSLGSDNAKFYINGVAAGTATKTGNTPSSSNATYVGNFGRLPNNTAYNFNGYTSNFRIDNSVQTISLPTAPLSTISGTQLLLNFTNAGVVDATAKNVLETVGNAQISTTQSKWGGGSIAFDGTSDYLLTPANNLYAFGTGNFTIEGWFNFNGTPNTSSLVSSQKYYTAGFNGNWILRITSTTSVAWASYDGQANEAYKEFTVPTMSSGTWYYFALVRSGTAITFYLNGTASSSGTLTDSKSLNDGSASGIFIGKSTINNDFNGYIDDLRITRGVARTITASPTAPFPVQ
jgi:hypothetical protein